jgi:hypothetical protein
LAFTRVVILAGKQYLFKSADKLHILNKIGATHILICRVFGVASIALRPPMVRMVILPGVGGLEGCTVRPA